jgi:sec-independent protein translocase protein TatC
MRAWRPPRRLGHGEEATLVEHLEELRQRLFVCIAAVAVGFIAAYAVHGHIIDALEQALPPEHRKLVTLTIGEPFMTAMWLSLYTGFLIALPVILWQAWAFFAPAFDPGHERMMKLFVLLASGLLVVGVLFGYYLALPAAAHFLTNYDSHQYTIMVRARDYIGFAAKVLVAMAIVFEMPIFVVGLTRIGIVSTTQLRRSRRLGYFLVFVVAVLLPGVDPVTTTLEAIPLLVLYEGSIWASVLLDRRSARAREAALQA